MTTLVCLFGKFVPKHTFHMVCFRVFNLSAVNIWGWIILYSESCPVHSDVQQHPWLRAGSTPPPPQVVINKNVSRHWQPSPGVGGLVQLPHLRIAGLSYLVGGQQKAVRVKSHGPGRRGRGFAGGGASPWGRHVGLSGCLLNEVNQMGVGTPNPFQPKPGTNSHFSGNVSCVRGCISIIILWGR